MVAVTLRSIAVVMLSKYHRHFVAGTLVLAVLLIGMAESVFAMSFRPAITILFIYYLGISLASRRPVITQGTLLYLFFLVVFTCIFYLAGSKNNLIIHLLTICFSVALLYTVMLTLRLDVAATWRYVRVFWMVIFFTLAAELLLVFFGYQDLLSDFFPESNMAYGFPAYRFLHNSFTSYFNLDFAGLNSISLGAQAYGQFCVMLTILGFSFTGKTIQRGRLVHCFWFLLVPLVMYSISPNTTAGVMYVFIIGYVLLIKYYIGDYSAPKFLLLSGIAIIAVLFYYIVNFGFVRTYRSDELFDLFVGTQLEYILTRTPSDYFLGVGLSEYYDAAPNFEIAYLSYLSVSGLLFGLVNLFLLLQFSYQSLRQIKLAYVAGSDRDTVEVQAANLLFVLSMFLSSIHFPVITYYLGSAIFIFHLAFGMYIIKMKSVLARQD